MPGILNVVDVDLCVEDNGEAHNTWDFHYMEKKVEPSLVVRRGQPFSLLLKTNREFDKNKDVLVAVLTVQDAEKPSVSRGTQVLVPLELKGSSTVTGLWKGEILTVQKNSLLVEILPYANCIIGPWKVEIDSKLIGSTTRESFKLGQPIFILFNPWCPDDAVFLEDEEERKEYVLGESGLLFRGTADRLRACPWNYSQYEDPVLDVSLWVLWNISKLPPMRRNDPIAVVRAITAAVNHADDDGMMEASWTGNYEGGTAPTKWTGSLDIMQRFWETKQPVKFAQCFTFAGVITTICRALGIPCRPVTNYESAHDTQGSLTVDVIVDNEGCPVVDKTTDSVWNYHVWNEVWMTRPDIEPGDYSGWQVVDGTPQEASEGVYRCGPASVKAVRRGEIKKHYDTSFVFAEVNADRVFWKEEQNDELKFLQKLTDDIGIKVITKAVGKIAGAEITENYKFTENSAEEREVMIRALRQSESQFTRFYLNQHIEDVQFELKPLDEVIIGQTIKANLSVKNRNPEKEHSVTATLRVDSIQYTGKTLAVVKKEKFNVTLKPKSESILTLELSYKEYAPHITEQGTFNFACLATVAETQFEYFSQDDFRISKPKIKIEAPAEVVVGQEFNVEVSIINPLQINLVSPRFMIQGAGMGPALKAKLTRISPGGEGKASFMLVAKHAGAKTIAVKFWSRDLQDVDGFSSVEVKE